MSFQKEYENYLVHSGIISEEELAHYGVPGMKWGVRKSVYKSLNRRQRKALKSYGQYRQGSDMLKKGGNYDAHKKAKAYKSKLEKAMGIKINDKSAVGSSRNSQLLTGILGGIAPTAITGIARASRANNQMNTSTSDLKDYLGKKKKK